MITMKKWVWLMLCLSVAPQVAAGPVNFGVGQSIIETAHSDAVGSGWDVQLGYVFTRKRAWDFGLQLQLTRQGDRDGEFASAADQAFAANAVYLSAQPDDWWLYFKGGVVHLDYRALDTDYEELGVGLGMGITYGTGDIRLHLLDYQRLRVGGDDFNVYTISFAVLLQ